MRVATDDDEHATRRTSCIAIASIVIATLSIQDVIGQESVAANVISGQITIFDIDGNEIVDRSDVVVFIDGLPDSASLQNPPPPPRMSHKDQQFAPRVMPMVRGTTVDFFNDDTVFHNVFSLSRASTFDLGIYPEGTSKLVTFADPGLVKIHCNIHPGMTSTLLVLNNELYATTDSNGNFRIEGIPDGEVTLRVWSEFSEGQSRTVSVEDGGHYEETFVVHETKVFVQHRNKFGKRYREKY